MITTDSRTEYFCIGKIDAWMDRCVERGREAPRGSENNACVMRAAGRVHRLLGFFRADMPAATGYS